MFSSDLHLMKFEDQFMINREEFNVKYRARYRLDIEMKVLPDVLLYRKIETRGFLIIEGGKPICQENALLTGEKVTLKN
jgi:hypothetical protein